MKTGLKLELGEARRMAAARSNSAARWRSAASCFWKSAAGSEAFFAPKACSSATIAARWVFNSASLACRNWLSC